MTVNISQQTEVETALECATSMYMSIIFGSSTLDADLSATRL